MTVFVKILLNPDKRDEFVERLLSLVREYDSEPEFLQIVSTKYPPYSIALDGRTTGPRLVVRTEPDLEEGEGRT